MPIRQYQQQLLETEPFVLDLPDADITYWRNFLDQTHADELFEKLSSNTSWRSETITIYGKQHLVPRLSCWMADDGLDYSYSNMTMAATPWSDTVLNIKSLLESKLALSFNSVLINYYRDGRDSNGWHADNEPELGSHPVIASISLGGQRDFQLRNIEDKSRKHSMSLEHASLLVMQGDTQSRWQHHIPKRAKAEPRINLTFRTIKLKP